MTIKKWIIILLIGLCFLPRITSALTMDTATEKAIKKGEAISKEDACKTLSCPEPIKDYCSAYLSPPKFDSGGNYYCTQKSFFCTCGDTSCKGITIKNEPGTVITADPNYQKLATDCTACGAPKSTGGSGDAGAVEIKVGKCAEPATSASAVEDEITKLKIYKPTYEINIPGLKFSDVTATLDENGNITIPYIGEYLATIYQFAMVVGSIIAVIMIIVIGVKITVIGGEERVAGLKRIGQIAAGLIILWGSYLILNTINPDLVNFKALKIQYIEKQDIVIPDDFSSAGDYGGGADSADSLPNFKQINYKTPFAMSDCPKDTIANSGCGPTSLAMVIKSFGYDVDPPQIAKLWVDYGHLKNGKSCGAVGSGGMFSDKRLFDKFKLTTIKLGKDKDKIIAELKKGHPVITSMRPISNSQPSRWTKGGHFVVAFKINPDGTLLIHDPGRRALCVEEINKCPGKPTVSLNAVNPDWYFPFVKSAVAFIKQ